MKPYIYFDHAATTLPKPDCVKRAVTDAFDTCGNPGRSGHAPSLHAAEIVYAAREAVCRLFGTDDPTRVVFTGSATVALNMAIKGYAKPHSHILYSNLEHNAVIRPVYALTSDVSRGITADVFDATGNDNEVIESFRAALRKETVIAAVAFASNVTGRVLPIRKLAELCHANGTLLITDVSQGAGCCPINAAALGADVLCFAGHKSLFGPQGTGGMLIMADTLPSTILEGGNGVRSADPAMAGGLPEYLEPGTLGTPGLAGLHAAIGYISRIGIGEIHERGNALITLLSEKLGNIGGVTLYGTHKSRTPVVLFNIQNLDAEEAAARLSSRGICVRAGLHCAPLAHTAYRTGNGGAIRASLAFINTPSEIEGFVNAVNRMR